MMIKITAKCSMGCSHCMNDAKPTGGHMDFETFKKSIEFQKTYGGPFAIITGGEPTEHPQFVDYLEYAIHELPGVFITITTNGLWMQNNYDYIKHLEEIHRETVMFQVSYVKEYYPIPVDLTLPVFSLNNVVVCTEIEAMYPLGRALDNGYESDSKAPRCFNIRSITRSIGYKDLRTVIGMLAVRGKFCCPHIAIDGTIKVGESDLCPPCSHIDKTNEEICRDIANFRCDKCDHVTKKLPPEYRQAIGEM